MCRDNTHSSLSLSLPRNNNLPLHSLPPSVKQGSAVIYSWRTFSNASARKWERRALYSRGESKGEEKDFFVDATSKTDTGLRGVVFQPPARKD